MKNNWSVGIVTFLIACFGFIAGFLWRDIVEPESLGVKQVSFNEGVHWVINYAVDHRLLETPKEFNQSISNCFLVQVIRTNYDMISIPETTQHISITNCSLFGGNFSEGEFPTRPSRDQRGLWAKPGNTDYAGTKISGNTLTGDIPASIKSQTP